MCDMALRKDDVQAAIEHVLTETWLRRTVASHVYGGMDAGHSFYFRKRLYELHDLLSKHRRSITLSASTRSIHRKSIASANRIAFDRLSFDWAALQACTAKYDLRYGSAPAKTHRTRMRLKVIHRLKPDVPATFVDDGGWGDGIPVPVQSHPKKAANKRPRWRI